MMNEGFPNPIMTQSLRTSQFVATVLMLIRRRHTESLDDFKRIVSNKTVARELSEHWDYYHMYDYKDIIEELAEMEPLIRLQQ